MTTYTGRRDAGKMASNFDSNYTTMKKTLAILIFSSSTLLGQRISGPMTGTLSAKVTESFPVFDIYGVVPFNFNGGGFGMGGFSRPLRTNAIAGGAEIRFGGDFYFTTLDRKTINDVPLLAPQTGAGKVRLNENMFGLNGVIRVSLPWNAKVSPYVDGFAGFRFTGADVTVTADQYQPGYEKSTTNNVDQASAFQYGLAGGFLVSLGKNVKLNTAVLFSRSDKPGTISNIRTAGLQGTGLVMDKKALSPDVIIFKVGLTFRISPTDKRGSYNCQCIGRSRGTVVRTGGFRTGAFRSVGGGAANRVRIGGRVMK
jgi:hypothetical protein